MIYPLIKFDVYRKKGMFDNDFLKRLKWAELTGYKFAEYKGFVYGVGSRDVESYVCKIEELA
ncbi:hypothetical protein [Priestia aryabhattai]|uniref:hypothetical protein n=1 Tax=Priestia aryabhattai TaxID=412384 RepID=UPI0015F5491A|nr:hypothetical protein [Priestia aryabhattai]